MRVRKLRENIPSLLIGGVIGVLIALPVNLPRIQKQAEQVRGEVRSGVEVTLPDADFTILDLSESNADHGDTLEEVMEGIRYEEYEHKAVFYDGHKLFETTDFDPWGVSYFFSYITPYQDEVRAKMVDLHNHPLPNYSFSYIDLKDLFLHKHVDTSIVVTCDANYILTAPRGGWPELSELRAFFKKRFKIDFSDDDLSDSERCSLVVMEDSGYVILMASDDGLGVEVGFTSKLILELANYFGLVYRVEYLLE